MANRYYSLLIRDTNDGVVGPWQPEFGDYNLDTVRYELEDYADHGRARKDMKIIITTPGQRAIDAGVRRANNNQPHIDALAAAVKRKA